LKEQRLDLNFKKAPIPKNKKKRRRKKKKVNEMNYRVKGVEEARCQEEDLWHEGQAEI